MIKEYEFATLRDCEVFAIIANACDREDYLTRPDKVDEDKERKKRREKNTASIQYRSVHVTRQGCVWFPVIAWLFPRIECRFGFGFARYLEIQDRQNMRNAMRYVILSRSLLATCPRSAAEKRIEYANMFTEACCLSLRYLISAYRIFCETMKPQNKKDGMKQLPLMLKGRNK